MFISSITFLIFMIVVDVIYWRFGFLSPCSLSQNQSMLTTFLAHPTNIVNERLYSIDLLFRDTSLALG